MKKLIGAVATLSILALSMACNYHAAPEPNASKSEEQARRARTPSGGGPETTDKNSVQHRPVTADNIQQGSAVPPAPADLSRPHPQPAQAQSPHAAQQQPSNSGQR